MAVITVRVSDKRYVIRPFSPAQTRRMAEAVRQSILARIRAGKNVHDSTSKPLTVAYERRKAKMGASAVRDWTLPNLRRAGGAGYQQLLNATKVKRTTPYGGTIGLTGHFANMVVARLNKIDEMWGFSPSDLRVLQDAAARELARPPRGFERVKEI